MFRLLSLKLVFWLHGIQKLSFRSKGHHGKGGNCSRTEGKLTLYSLQIIWLRGLYSCFIGSIRSASVQQHCEAPTMSMCGLIEKRSRRSFDLSKCAELLPLILGNFIPPSTLRCSFSCNSLGTINNFRLLRREHRPVKDSKYPLSWSKQ